MKKTLFLIILLSSVFVVNAQRGSSTIKWLSIALKGGYGNSILFNDSYKNDPNISLDYVSPSYMYGGRFGITYGDYVGVSVEYQQVGFSQKYDIKNGSEVYNKETKLKSTDIAILLRFTSPTGFYAEAGPKFITLNDVSQTTSISVTDPTVEESDYLKSKYVEKYNGFTFGLGLTPYNGDRVTLSVGIRGTYSGNSIIADENYFSLTDDGNYTASYKDATTKPFHAQFVVELNYFFGFWGDATCGRGRLMFFQ